MKNWSSSVTSFPPNTTDTNTSTHCRHTHRHKHITKTVTTTVTHTITTTDTNTSTHGRSHTREDLTRHAKKFNEGTVSAAFVLLSPHTPPSQTPPPTADTHTVTHSTNNVTNTSQPPTQTPSPTADPTRDRLRVGWRYFFLFSSHPPRANRFDEIFGGHSQRRKLLLCENATSRYRGEAQTQAGHPEDSTFHPRSHVTSQVGISNATFRP